MAYMKPWIDSVVLRFSTGHSTGHFGSNINPIYGVISERSFDKTKNSTDNEYKETREESEESEESLTTTTISSV